LKTNMALQSMQTSCQSTPAENSLCYHNHGLPGGSVSSYTDPLTCLRSASTQMVEMRRTPKFSSRLAAHPYGTDEELNMVWENTKKGRFDRKFTSKREKYGGELTM